MQNVAFTEFRKNASALFSSVEAGEMILVTRHGKRIAEITPWDGTGKSDVAVPSWKGKRIRPSASGKSLSRLILEERESAP